MTPHRPLLLRRAASFDEVVTAIVGHHCGGTAVAAVARTPWVYTSTFALDEVVIRLADGCSMSMLVKDLGRWAALSRGTPSRPDAYADPPAGARHVRLGARSPRPGHTALLRRRRRTGTSWLFLEKVEGVELYQVGEIEHREAAARWLARLHGRYATPAEGRQALPPRLVRYDADLRTWVEWASALAAGDQPAVSTVRAVAQRFDEVVDRLAAAPCTLVHGQFYASNILVQPNEHGTRVRAVDWETAGVGPGVLDVAALVCGWGERDRCRLVSAYGGAKHGGADEGLLSWSRSPAWRLRCSGWVGSRRGTAPNITSATGWMRPAERWTGWAGEGQGA